MIANIIKSNDFWLLPTEKTETAANIFIYAKLFYAIEFHQSSSVYIIFCWDFISKIKIYINRCKNDWILLLFFILSVDQTQFISTIKNWWNLWWKWLFQCDMLKLCVLDGKKWDIITYSTLIIRRHFLCVENCYRKLYSKWHWFHR